MQVFTAERAPRDFAALRALIHGRRAAMPKRLAQVAAFALAHPDEIAFGTAASVAGKAKVQPSTLVRFSQALGYQGFSDLQSVFRQELRERLPSYEDRLASLSGRAAGTSRAAFLLDGFADAAERSASGLRERIDEAALERAVAVLSRAGTIHLLGQRRSFPVTAYMAYALAKLSVKASLVASPLGLEEEEIGLAGSGDAAVAVSFAPYAPGTVRLANAAAGRRVPIVAITDSSLSPLAKIARVMLEVHEADFEGFRSLSATFALAMTLCVGVAERRRSG